jgi:hypothetical protein
MSYTLTNDYVWKEIGQQVVVLHFETGAYWTLNDTASVIWKSILDGRSPDDVVERLVEEFSVARDGAQTDIQEFLKTCIEKKMLLPA